jgi:negative regulator of flagellin synthesis FlgM
MKVRDTSQIRAMQPGATPEPPKDPREKRESALDRVSTGESAKVEAAVAAAAHGASAARAARLVAIEAAVRQGTYRPDPHRIAQEILNDAEISARIQALLSR